MSVGVSRVAGQLYNENKKARREFDGLGLERFTTRVGRRVFFGTGIHPYPRTRPRAQSSY